MHLVHQSGAKHRLVQFTPPAQQPFYLPLSAPTQCRAQVDS